MVSSSVVIVVVCVAVVVKIVGGKVAVVKWNCMGIEYSRRGRGCGGGASGSDR